jgi:hypothetical protein
MRRSPSRQRGPRTARSRQTDNRNEQSKGAASRCTFCLGGARYPRPAVFPIGGQIPLVIRCLDDLERAVDEGRRPEPLRFGLPSWPQAPPWTGFWRADRLTCRPNYVGLSFGVTIGVRRWRAPAPRQRMWPWRSITLHAREKLRAISVSCSSVDPRRANRRC